MKPVILIARPRSGTTALRAIVATHPHVYALGEIFNDNYLCDALSYYHYYLNTITDSPRLSIPTTENCISLFSGYIDYVVQSPDLRQKEQRWVFLSINYNTLHSINGYWQNIYDPPHLIAIIMLKRYHVVHLVRRNVLAAAVSEMRARLTGVWHIKQGDLRPSAADERIVIDPRSLVRQLRARKLEIDLVEDAFREYERCLTLEYENLFDRAAWPRECELDSLAEFLGLDPPIRSHSEYSITRNHRLQDSIENYDEISQVLVETEFAPYLDP